MADSKIVFIDLDGTLCRHKWPGIGEWFPHARIGVQSLLDAGCIVKVFTYRTSLDSFGTERDPAEVMEQWNAVRTLLDDAGLQEVGIWDGEGKPFYHVLVDDRAIWFPGRERSWKVMPERILARLA